MPLEERRMPAHAPLFPARIGLGTWKMGEDGAARAREIAAVSTRSRLAIA